VTAINYGVFYRELAEGVMLSPSEARLRDMVINREPKASALEALVAALEESGLAGRTIGLDESSMNPGYVSQLEQRLPGLKLKPAASVFQEVRKVKTAEEVRRLREAVRVTEVAIGNAVSIAKDGVTEAVMANEFKKSLIDQGARLGFTCLRFGKLAAYAQRPPGSVALRKGDLIWLDVGCFYQGYPSDLMRTFAFGDPGERARRYYQALLAGQQRGFETVKAGAKAKDVFYATVAAVREAGIPHFRRHNVGHGLGLETYDPPMLAPGDEGILEEGMVINVEPPYYEIGFGGLGVEDTLLVTGRGFELLTSISRNLEILE
jgi:Xaa-Pro aminopeptidase